MTGDPDVRLLLVRAACLYLPLSAAALLWISRRPGRRAAAGALLAGAWCLALLPAADTAARRLGAWSYAARGGTLHGFPVDLYLGWCALWGPVAALATPRRRIGLPIAFGAAALLDLAAMPLCRPVVVLGPPRLWLAGEILTLTVVFLPAQLLARWTATNRRLGARVLLQIGAFCGLFLFLVPSIVDERFGLPGWPPPLLATSAGRAVAMEILLLLSVPGLAAVAEFFQRGGGTPLPYDPPLRLVVTGPYAYVANPMQISMTFVLACVGAVLRSPWLAAAALVSFAYSAGFAAWHEGIALEERFRGEWRRYRREVRAWVPRWRPFRARDARLYVASGCGTCSRVGAWLARRRPAGLEILAAEEHPSRDLTRITYEDGPWAESGVGALARAVEHIHLGWALVGWTARLPGVRHVLQAVVDVSGGGPRRIERLAAKAPPA